MVTKMQNLLYKLMSNIAFGKIMENLRKRIDVILASNKKNI